MTADTPRGAVLTMGEGLAVLRAREPGSLAMASDLVVGTGGAEVNVAIGLARLGMPVTWVGRVGRDDFGRRVVRELRAEGVEAIAPIDEHAATGLLVKSTPVPGRTEVVYYRAGSAGSRLVRTDLDGIDMAGFSLVHVTGITPALSPSASDAVDALVARARDAGVPVSFDVNHRSRLWHDPSAAAERYRGLAARADIVFAGHDEASMLLGRRADPAELARAIAGGGPREVVVKLASQGALAYATTEDGPVVHRRDAESVAVVDTVGAGDAFVAGYLAERVVGEPIDVRLKTAVRAGAAACMHAGDWEGAATRAELARLFEGEPSDPVQR